MERPGEKLKRIRERLKLTYRDVERASQRIAECRSSDEFAIALSRLADIENKQTVPTIYRIYTLSAVYRLDYQEVLRWYGVPTELMASDSLQVGLDETHLVHFKAESTVNAPPAPDDRIDLNQTTFLGRRWAKLGIDFLNSADLRQHRYGFIGLEDWSMHPILRPGSMVLIDQNKRRIAAGGWASEIDRPIYFLEHRGGYACGWCSLSEDRLIVEHHPACPVPPSIFQTAETDVIGQVAGVAMHLDSRKHRHARDGTTPATSPDL